MRRRMRWSSASVWGQLIAPCCRGEFHRQRWNWYRVFRDFSGISMQMERRSWRHHVGMSSWAMGSLFWATRHPLPNRSAAELASRMQATAAADSIEWGPYANAAQQFGALLKNEVPVERIITQAPDVPALQDDRPVNEYYLLRRFGSWRYPGHANDFSRQQ